MSQTPKDTNIQFTAEQVAQINACERPDQIQPLLEKFMLENGNARLNADGVAELVIGPAASAREWVQTVELGGEQHTVTGTSEIDLARNVTAFYKEHGGQTPTQKRGADGKFVAEPPAVKIPEDDQELQAAVAELRLQVTRGEILVDEFESKKQELTSGLREQRDWQTAVEAFKNSDAGSDWVGGAENMKLMTDMLVELEMIDGLDSTQKVAALAGIWGKMKSTGTYFERQASPEEIAETLTNEAIRDQQQEEYEKEIAAAKTASEIQDVNTRFGLRTERSSSSLFER